MQSYDTRSLEVALVGADPLARRGLASALGLEAVRVRHELGLAEAAGAAGIDAIIWDDGPLGADGLGGGSHPLPGVGDGRAVPWIGLTATSARARELLHGGFRGALRRDVEPGQLAHAIDAVVRGLVVMDPGFVDLFERPPETGRDETLQLSPREHEVLELLAEGLSNKDIAVELGMSPHTAKFHVTALLEKLGAESRTEAVVRAARAGLVTL